MWHWMMFLVLSISLPASAEKGDLVGPCETHLTKPGAKPPSMVKIPPFSNEDSQLILGGTFTRPARIEDLPESERTFNVGLGMDILISSHDFFKNRRTGTTRWNPVAFPVENSGAAFQAHKRVLDILATKPAVDLLAGLNGSAKEWVRYFVNDGARHKETLSLEQAALAVGVAHALGLPDSTPLGDQTVGHYRSLLAPPNASPPPTTAVSQPTSVEEPPPPPTVVLANSNSDFTQVADVHLAESSDPSVGALVRTFKQHKAEFYKALRTEAQPIWERDLSQDFTKVLSQLLAEKLASDATELRANLAKDFPLTKNAVELLIAEWSNPAGHQVWLSTQAPDLAFGEKITAALFPTVVQIPPASAALIDTLAQLGDIGDNNDLSLLKQILATLSPDFLKKMIDAGYSIVVARNNVTNGARELRGRRTGASVLIDNSEGIHERNSERRRIVIRSYMQDGKLVLDAVNLLHEIGHALDLVLHANGGKPLHVQPEFADSFTTEHGTLPPYFHTQVEFMAESFARYALDPDRATRNFPGTAAAFAKHGFDKILTDRASLVRLYQAMLPKAPVTAKPDPIEYAAKSEQLNQIRAQQRKNREAYVLELQGDEASAITVAKNLATHLITMRAPMVGPFGTADGFVQVNAATFNDQSALRQVLDNLIDGHGAVLFVSELRSIPPNSPGFKVLRDFFERMGDLAVLVLAGSASELKPFSQALPTIVRQTIKLEPMTPAQVAELVHREVLDDGFVLSDEALALLIEQSTAGGYEAAIGKWRKIKIAQMNRVAKLSAEIARDPRAIAYVLARDVSSGHTSKRNPMDEIQCMIGLDEVKDQATCVISAVTLAKREADLGLTTSDPPRLNLLFSGNPGTGKTTVAKRLAESLFEQGYVKRKQVAEVKVQDLVGRNPEDAVKRLFEANKDGVIFVDEIHQLADTDEGKRAFRAMIPYLADPEYQRTVFIGAGYPDRLRDLIRDVDPGGERRFMVINFQDYTKPQLAQIVDLMLNNLGLKASEEVRIGIVDRVVRKQRSMKHPGNGGDVESIIGLARQKQRARLASLSPGGLTAEDLVTLKLEDVAREPDITPEEVWREIDALKGLEKPKEKLRDIQALFDYNRALGVDILTGVEPYFILEGPAGAGKSTLARLIGKLFAANDVIPESKVVTAVGGDLLGQYVGNSTNVAVRKLFESAWGKTLFIDEIGALAKAVGGYEDLAAKEILTQMENHRGKFVLVIADYPHNIVAFLRMDAGLPRRFGVRLTVTPMAGRDAADLLHELLAESKLKAQKLDEMIVKRLDQMSQLPGWASGGDVRTLASKVRSAQAAQFMESRKKGESIDPLEVHPNAMNKALDDLEADVRIRPDPAGPSRATPSNLQYQHQHEHDGHQHEEQKPAIPLTEEEKKTLETISEIDRQFGPRLNDPEELERQESDPQSEYNRALAEKLNILPEQAKELRKEMKAKTKIVVNVMEKEVTQHFKYHCPFCGGIDSPSCGYINHPLEWKIQHSLRKPWTEVREVLREKVIESGT